MDETQALLKILAYADKEIEAEETVLIEKVMKEFGVEAYSAPKPKRDTTLKESTAVTRS